MTEQEKKATEGEGEPEEECGFCIFMKAGGCKEPFTAWSDCVDKFREGESDFTEECKNQTIALQDCMIEHKDYYRDFLAPGIESAESADSKQSGKEPEKQAESLAGEKEKSEEEQDSSAKGADKSKPEGKPPPGPEDQLSEEDKKILALPHAGAEPKENSEEADDKPSEEKKPEKASEDKKPEKSSDSKGDDSNSKGSDSGSKGNDSGDKKEGSGDSKPGEKDGKDKGDGKEKKSDDSKKDSGDSEDSGEEKDSGDSKDSGKEKESGDSKDSKKDKDSGDSKAEGKSDEKEAQNSKSSDKDKSGGEEGENSGEENEGSSKKADEDGRTPHKDGADLSGTPGERQAKAATETSSKQERVLDQESHPVKAKPDQGRKEEATKKTPEAEKAKSDDAADAKDEEGKDDGEEEEEEEEPKPEIKVQTAPYDRRFVTTNQARHCYTKYQEYHKCVEEKGEDAKECNWFQRAYRSICPGDWVLEWNEQREAGTFPGKYGNKPQEPAEEEDE